MYLLKSYLSSFAVFLVIDLIWLGFIAKNLYAKHLGFIMAKNINWTAAIIFYMIFVGGILFFVVNPALEKDSMSYAIIVGALFGFITYPENKGKIMDQGLWGYTRHPNYFGEATMWWGIGILAVSSGASILSFISPIVITYLLLFVSGVPMLEKSFANRPGYKQYADRTPVFFPWFPKK